MKKKTFIILILPILVLVVGYFIRETMATSNPHAWDTGLVAYWSFDGQYTTSTDGTADVSGNDNWGTFNGGVKPAAGIVGQALSFDGSDDYVDMGDVLDSTFTGNTFTFEVWIKPETTIGTHPIIWKYSGGGDNRQFQFQQITDTITFYAAEPDNSNNITYTSGSIISTSTWTHIILVVDKNEAAMNDKVDLYQDGVLVAFTTSDTPFPTLADVSTTLRIGSNDGVSNDFNGLIDEVRIYNRALSAEEIIQHYEQTRRNFQVASANPHTWDSGLVGYWDLNGQHTTSTGTTGQSSNAHHGEISGAVLRAGIVGQALSFDGVDDYVDCGTDASLNIVGAVTLEAWVKLDIAIASQPDTYPAIVTKEINSHTNRNYALYIYTPSDVLSFNAKNVAGDAFIYESDVATASTYLDDLKWHFLVAVWDRANTTAYVYIDGVERAKDTGQTDGDAYTAGDNRVSLGTLTGYGNSFLDGIIDEVRIYNRVLSADEIMQHYEQTRRNIKIATANPHDWSTGLVGYWNFNGQNTTSSGTRDMSANNNWGELKNGVKPVAGIIGQALSFDGVNDYVEISNDASLNPSQVTMEAWAKSDTTNWNAWTCHVSKRYGNIPVYQMGGGAGSKKYTFYIGDGVDNYYIEYTPTFDITDWHHYVATYDGSDMSLYIDGMLVGGPTTKGIDLYTSDTGPLMIGLDDNYVGSRHFDGSIDEVRIYNRALSAEEVKQHYEQSRRNLRL